MWLGCIFLCCWHQCLAMVVTKVCQCRGRVSRERVIIRWIWPLLVLSGKD
jgi:hypothetical protein